MTFLNVKNRAESTLASGITDVATSLSVAAGEGANFPTTNFHITIEDEILLCSSRSTDVFTIEREAEGTTGVAHSTGAAVELRITAEMITELQVENLPLAGGTLTGGLTLVAGTTTVFPVRLVAGTNLTTPEAGTIEFDGTNLYLTV